MSIYEYDEGDLASGFIGLRVSVQVNGQHRQRYFNFRDITRKRIFLPEYKIKLLRREAKKLEKAWLEEQREARNKRIKDARQTKRAHYRTGVSGIALVLRYSRDRKGNDRAYQSWCFVVHGSHNKKRFTKSFPIQKMGYKYAWDEAVKFYAQNKGIKSYRHLLKRIPKATQLKRVYP